MERHHLFPKKYLGSLGVTTIRQVNAIANMAFLDWAENAAISGTGPAEYWPTMAAKGVYRQAQAADSSARAADRLGNSSTIRRSWHAAAH